MRKFGGQLRLELCGALQSRTSVQTMPAVKAERQLNGLNATIQDYNLQSQPIVNSVLECMVGNPQFSQQCGENMDFMQSRRL